MENISKALLEFQKRFKGLKPDATNPFFRSTYISLDGILETVRPILSDCKLVLIQDVAADGNEVEVKTKLIHESGESIETGVLRMTPIKKQEKGYKGPEETTLDPQAMGSCITYAKRYQLGALLGVCETVDDDGNGAAAKTQPKPKPQTQSDSSQLRMALVEAGIRTVDALNNFMFAHIGEAKKIDELAPDQVSKLLKIAKETKQNVDAGTNTSGT